MTCSACTREDCGSCVNCKDKTKFGGKGRKKQRCIYRVCVLMEALKDHVQVRPCNYGLK